MSLAAHILIPECFKDRFFSFSKISSCSFNAVSTHCQQYIKEGAHMTTVSSLILRAGCDRCLELHILCLGIMHNGIFSGKKLCTYISNQRLCNKCTWAKPVTPIYPRLSLFKSTVKCWGSGAYFHLITFSFRNES